MICKDPPWTLWSLQNCQIETRPRYVLLRQKTTSKSTEQHQIMEWQETAYIQTKAR